MVQGTASSVGKSVLVAALCRIFRQDGFDIAPFKAQNMSNNSYATADGFEIGRAQAVQAEAAGAEATVDMNPVLLKPEADNRSQIVVRGRPVGPFEARAYYAMTEGLWKVVTEALDRLRSRHEIVVIEGAGSPAEVNLRDRDIVNMRVALRCQSPVFLVADIDRGGVFASIVGTLALLSREEASLVKGIVINKFRGDLSLFKPGVDWLQKRTGIPIAGVLPYWHDIGIAEEDSVPLDRRRALWRRKDYLLDIAVVGLPHIANFDDFDSLEQEPGVRLRYVEDGDSIEEPDLIVLPGTKSTVAGLKFLRRSGLASELIDAARGQTPMIGICGGYQMLGTKILDPESIESETSSVEGLGLLPVVTVFERLKSTHRVKGRVLAENGIFSAVTGSTVTGYEIHMGKTERSGGRPAFLLEERSGQPVRLEDGCISEDGTVAGTYIHGIFENEALRRSVLSFLAARKGVALPGHESASPDAISQVISKEQRYDRLASRVRANLDMDLVYRTIGLAPRR
ncbi:MAG: cobyric acid synthase [Chloroflexi bacterium]|nr:cobyric acid synthase [Chloroflexota bacterium]